MDTRTIALPTLTFSLLAFSILVFSAFFAASARAQEVPIPTLTPYVTDLAGVLGPQYTAAINDYASQLDAATTAQIAVLTVNSTQPMDINTYAVDVFAKNGIGQKGIDNGVLVVVAVADRQWKIEVGYGLEGVLNDAKVSRIGRQYMSAYFVNGSYGEGTYLAIKALGDVIAGNETIIPGDGTFLTTSDILIFVLPFASVLLVFAAIAVALYVSSHRCPKCGGWMKCTSTDTQTCCTCPKCGYRKCKKRSRVPFFFFYGGGTGGGGWSSGGGGGGFGGGGSGGGGGGGGW